MNKQLIEISWVSILKVVSIIVALWLTWLIRDVLVLGFIVIVIVAALSPIVDKWSIKIHRGFAVALVFLFILLIFGLIGFTIIPPLASEIQDLAQNLPSVVDRFGSFIGSSLRDGAVSTKFFESISNGLSSFGSGLLNTTRSVIGGVVATFTVVVLSLYLLLEEQGGRKLIIKLLPLENRDKVASILQKIGHKMGAWLRGQLLLGLVIGVIDFIIVSLVGLPFALTLGVWAGVTELIPYIGPVLGAVPAVIIGFSVSPLVGFIVLVSFVLVQQFESNFLVPKIMGKAVGLSPVVIIFAILIGARLAGFLGVVLAVPVAAIISVLIQEWPTLRKRI